MKVICVKYHRLKWFDRSNKPDLTVGKIYDLIQYKNVDGERAYYYVSDNGTELLYSDDDKELIPLEQWRDNQIESVLQ